MRSVTLEEYGIERYTKGLEIRETVELDTPSKMREVFSWF
jgi:hypothetical protein